MRFFITVMVTQLLPFPQDFPSCTSTIQNLFPQVCIFFSLLTCESSFSFSCFPTVCLACISTCSVIFGACLLSCTILCSSSMPYYLTISLHWVYLSYTGKKKKTEETVSVPRWNRNSGQFIFLLFIYFDPGGRWSQTKDIVMPEALPQMVLPRLWVHMTVVISISVNFTINMWKLLD